MKKIRAVFVRHGLSVYNDEGRIAGRVDVGLSNTGIERLMKIREEDIFPKTDLYFCTPLKRTRETAEILFEDVDEFVALSEFMELDFGDVDGVSYEKIDLSRLFKDWHDGIDRDNIEHIDDFATRINTAIHGIIRETLSKDKTSFTLISHSCVMRHIVHYFKPMERKEFLKFRTINGRGFVIDIDYDEKEDKILDFEIEYL